VVARDGTCAGYVPRQYAPAISALLGCGVALDARVMRRLIVPDDTGKWVVRVARSA
jgi:hypothetical protein